MSSDQKPEPLLANDEAMVQVESLSKCYRSYDQPINRLVQSLWGGRARYSQEFWALRDVSFSLQKGETMGIVGRNGSGKSTLLQIIAGTLKPTSGSSASRGKVAALLELGSGFNPDFTGRQNVYLNASILGLSRDETNTRIESILAYAEIGEFIDQPVRKYSTGMVMRLAFAVVVHVDAEVLIIDEALAVGDAFFMQKCMRYLNKFREHGTLLFVSHDAGAVTSFCDRALWLDAGRVKMIDGAKSVMEAYMEETMGERQGNKLRPLPDKSDAQIALRQVRKFDCRQDIIDRSQLRNDFQIFPFDPAIGGIGQGILEILDVALLNAQGRPIHMALAGEEVILEVEIVANGAVENLIAGFYLKNKHGQLLFGDNTFLCHPEGIAAAQGDKFVARFNFTMPRLGAADYFITVGLAEGTQENPVVQHWKHEALRITATGGGFASGLVGLPMHQIELRRTHDNA